jgi:hypothetical protein
MLTAVLGLGFHDARLDLPQFRIAIHHELQRRPFYRGGLLRHVRQHPARRQGHLAMVGVQLVADQREEARLAAAVRSHQADLLARVDVHDGVFEEHSRAAAKRQV